MNRTSAFTRMMAWRHAIRKRRIDRACTSGGDYYDNLHQYSKNKVHCSCPACNAKTRNKGRRHVPGNYAPALNYSASDQRKINAMDIQEEELFDFDFSENL